jgi:hypothetical protein
MPNITPQQMLTLTANYADNIRKAVSSSVAVGLPSEKVGDKVYGDGNTVISVGASHEYGATGLPRRSFLSVIATNYSKEAFVTRGFGQWPDISQSTKEAKGSSQILIDTGTLRNSITYVVRSD